MLEKSPDRHDSVPHWLKAAEPHAASPLGAAVRADVCILGAGVAGLSIAYELALRGASVVVLERADIGSGESGRSTAHLTAALDDRYFHIERLHGSAGARVAAESHSAAIERVARIVMSEEIDCDFRRVDGHLFAAPDAPRDLLRREFAAARRAGVPGLELYERGPLTGDLAGPCIRFPGQAQLDPIKYLSGLSRAIIARHGQIFTGTQAMTVNGGKEAHVQTADGNVVTARHVVVATNTPVNNLLSIHAKQAAYRTYVIAADVPKGVIPIGLYWDTATPSHYVRLDTRAKDRDTLIVGGEDHRTGHEADNEERWARLSTWMHSRFPASATITSCWSGQIMQSIDGLAYIGRNPMDAHNVWVATGDSGNGMTHGVIAGMLLASLIEGSDHPFAKLYDPTRVTLRASGELLRQNLDTAAQYAHWLEAGDVSDEADISPGRGAIVREGVRLLAVYRDLHGTFHRCSAVCPHLGGIVQFNGAEASWDCPCHGSRFDAFGHVMRGPANVDLLPVEGPHEEPVTVEDQPPPLGIVPSV